jgi:hypothetical protein
MLKSNPRLRDEVKLDRELNEILAQTDILEFRRKILFEQKRQKKRKGPYLNSLLIAASLLLFIGIEVILIMNKTDHRSSVVSTNSNQLPKENKSILNIKSEKLTILSEIQNKAIIIDGRKKDTSLNKRFRKNNSFENMIGSTRHSGYFRMNAPRIGYKYGKKMDIHFEWTLAENEEIELKIMDNTGESVHESGLIQNNSYVLNSGTLLSGLYYFIVKKNDDILFIGKFVVD